MANKDTSKKTIQTGDSVNKPAPNKRAKRERRQKSKSYSNTVGIAALVLIGGWAAVQAGILELGVDAGPVPKKEPAIGEEKEIISRTVVEAGEPLSSSRIALVEETNQQPASITIYGEDTAAAEMTEVKASSLAPQMQALLKTEQDTFPLLTLATYSAVLAKAPELDMLLLKLAEKAPQEAKADVKTLQASIEAMGVLTLDDVQMNADVPALGGQDDLPPPTELVEEVTAESVLMPTWWEKTLGQYIYITKTEEMPSVTLATEPVVMTRDSEEQRQLYTVVDALDRGLWDEARAGLVALNPEKPFVQLGLAYVTQRQALAHLLDLALQHQAQ